MTQQLTWTEIQSICRQSDLFVDAHHWLLPMLDSSASWPSSDSLNAAAKKVVPNFSWEFVPQPRIPRRAKSRGDSSLTGYVAMIGSQGKIPVREKNLHDFLNCLSFLMFPLSKLQLNIRHLRESPGGLKPGQNRTRVQDLLTIFDEGGVIRLIDDHQNQKDLIFGHAVYEHVLQKKTLRAARLDLHFPGDLLAKTAVNLIRFADESFASWLENEDNCLSSKEFSYVWIPNDPPYEMNPNFN